MTGFAHDARQDFWQSPANVQPAVGTTAPAAASEVLAPACEQCGSEFLIGAKFCHACGGARPAFAQTPKAAIPGIAELWGRILPKIRSGIHSAAAHGRNASFPDWLRYLHFHEIKRWVGLPTASLVAFIVGLGCIVGAIGVSLFYSASTLAEFQAIQMWRIEWLLAATAAFVAGILLKTPSNSGRG
jgi:hypothetical protein